ncbi:MAG: prolyl oligopeptidase family serine peptidase [Phycisphaerales bacterium]|nr:MAG: prolyl oligopeptidase family serine peptidase [Phycisphaerales bacterium]
MRTTETPGSRPSHAEWCALAMLAIVAFALVGCRGMTDPASAMSANNNGLLYTSVTVNDASHLYAVYAPREYKSNDKPWPLIIFLNGRGECGTDGQRQAAVGLFPAALGEPEAWPFVIALPQKPVAKTQWIEHDDLVMAVLRETQERFNIDPKRIYLTGLSQGGAGTWAIGAKHPDLFAALAPVCGYGDPAILTDSLKGMPIWAFHGEADNVVPPQKTRDLAAKAKALGAIVTQSYYPGVNHNSWDKAYREEDLGEWFLEHVK